LARPAAATGAGGLADTTLTESLTTKPVRWPPSAGAPGLIYIERYIWSGWHCR
jgi:hypothetical protein